MPSRVDEMIDRRRLRRKLTFWRVIALVIAAMAIIGIAQFSTTMGVGSDHIARIKIEGTITEDEDLLDTIEEVRKADRVKGVILTVDSPGGTTVGGEALFNAVRRLTEAKPVVAQVGTLAASAGYMVAIAADSVVARHSSIVGSIGVIVQVPNVSGLMDKIGVQVDEIKSAPLKAEPSPFNPTTEAERQMIQSLVSDSFEWFLDLVEERRPLSRDEIRALADGAIFTGRQALQRKLIDRLGGVDEAKAQLVEKGVSADLEIVEWEPSGTDDSFIFAKAALQWMIGFSSMEIEALLKRIGGDRMFLDGLLSLWQPESNLPGD